MADLLFFVGCGLSGLFPAALSIWRRRAGLAVMLTVIWFLLSAILLWSIGLGPHGFILFAFIPFWAGNFVGLIFALIRINKERMVL